jgi:AP-2 complex subunit alpha
MKLPRWCACLSS